MIFLGAVVNGIAVILGGVFGVLIHRGISEKLSNFMIQGLGLCVVYIGIKGALSGENITIVILSIVAGGMIGQGIDFDKWLNQMGAFIQSKVKSTDSQNSLAEGFVNLSIIICVGAMSIIGSMQSGISGNHEILYAKALIDMVIAIIMGATMGLGVAFAGISVLLYELALTLSANIVSGYLSETVVNEMTCVGSLVIVGIGMNMLKITDIKVANFLVAPFFPILFCLFL